MKLKLREEEGDDEEMDLKEAEEETSIQRTGTSSKAEQKPSRVSPRGKAAQKSEPHARASEKPLAAKPLEAAKPAPTTRASKASTPSRVTKPFPSISPSPSPCPRPRGGKVPPNRVTKPSPAPRITKPSSPSQAEEKLLSKAAPPAHAPKPSSPAKPCAKTAPAQATKVVTRTIRLNATDGGALRKKFATYGNKGRGAILARGLRQSTAPSTPRDRVATGRCEKSVPAPKRSLIRATAGKAVLALSSR